VTTMDSTYANLAEFAQSWGLVYFVAVFVAVLIYALWPSRRQDFEVAARIPLRED
jgi:cytochrome c oxidase cbb3-type subunit 4